MIIMLGPPKSFFEKHRPPQPPQEEKKHAEKPISNGSGNTYIANTFPVSSQCTLASSCTYARLSPYLL